MKNDKKRIVIVGAGFAGIQALKEIGDLPNAEIIVIDKESSQTFQPLLFSVATGGVGAEDILSPVREFINGRKNVEFLKAIVSGIDVNNKSVMLETGEIINYDYLLVTCGSESNFFGMTDVERYSLGLKNTTEALELRNTVLLSLEKAAAEADEEKRQKLLTFVVIGGGPTGVEVAGGLAELLYTKTGLFYPSFSRSDIKVYLLEGMGCILPQVRPKEQERAKLWLEQMGVTVRLNTMLTSYDGEQAVLKDGTVIPTNVLIWGAGVRAASLLNTIGLEQGNAQRLMVEPTLQVMGRTDVFAAGDTAHIAIDSAAKPLPMTAAVAVQSGALAGRNIRHLCLDEELENFVYNDKGFLCVVGRGKAVGNMKGISLSGWFCWLAWSGIHIVLPFSPHIRWSLFWKFLWNACRNVQPYRNISESISVKGKEEIKK